MFTLMCIDFHISNCRNRFEVGFSKYKQLLMSTYGLLVSSRCQVGFYKKEIDYFLWHPKTYVDFHFLTYHISISLIFLTKK